jgi:hypothetical protein
VRRSEFGSAAAVHKESMVSEIKQLASQQGDVVSGFQIDCGPPSVETCNPFNYQMEMERYLVECIEHHQRLIGCTIVGCTEQNRVTLVDHLFILYSLLRRFSEKLNLLWQTAYCAQFLTASILICFIGLTAVSVSTNNSTLLNCI